MSSRMNSEELDESGLFLDWKIVFAPIGLIGLVWLLNKLEAQQMSNRAIAENQRRYREIIQPRLQQQLLDAEAYSQDLFRETARRQAQQRR